MIVMKNKIDQSSYYDEVMKCNYVLDEQTSKIISDMFRETFVGDDQQNDIDEIV